MTGLSDKMNGEKVICEPVRQEEWLPYPSAIKLVGKEARLGDKAWWA